MIVNGGTSTYDRSPQRHLKRSTRSHSTVEINGENSSEVWDGFRVARRARPFGIHVARDEEFVRITAADDGYRRLPERAVHKRSWIFVDQNLTVTDEIMGSRALPGRGAFSSGSRSLRDHRSGCEERAACNGWQARNFLDVKPRS